MPRRQGRRSDLRQLAALLGSFGLGIVLVLVMAVVAPGVVRLGPDGGLQGPAYAAAAGLTATAQEIGEALVREAEEDAAAEAAEGADGDADGGAEGDADAETDAAEPEPEPEPESDPEPASEPEPEPDERPDEPSAPESSADDEASAPEEVPSSASGADANAVLELVNVEREAAGCPAVRADEALDDLALAHSADMAARGYFDHTTPDGLSPWDRADAAGVSGLAAENIARGQPDAASVVAAWMDSPGHRANILNCDHVTHGLGVHHGSGGPWWTQLFGR